MGGLGTADAVHDVAVPRRRARARRHPAVRRLLLEGPDHRGRARARRLVRRGALRGRASPARSSPASTRSGSSSSSSAASRAPFVRSTTTAHGHGTKGSLAMLSRSASLAVLAIVGGWLQFADFWDRHRRWLDPVAEPARRGERDAGGGHDHPRGRARPAGIAVAWCIYGTRRASRCRRRAASGPCSSTSSTSTSSTTRSSTGRPTVVARAFYRLIEEPLVAGSLTGGRLGTREALARRPRRLQTGLRPHATRSCSQRPSPSSPSSSSPSR